MIRDLLTELNIHSENSGSCYSENSWSTTTHAGLIQSINPDNETVIARVHNADYQDYEKIMQKAYESFLHWRLIPAPKRGEIIREIGQRVRGKKEMLAKLITLEMGKSFQESLGEVQEVIDMADLAVGQSRMLYGHTMPSERFQHRLYEQWHPYGPTAIITAFNFPMAVWSWNAFLATICGNTVVWKPSSKTPLCAIAIQHICNKVMQQNQLEGVFNLFISNKRDISGLLLDDKRLPLISFTGSSRVGKQVYEHVAKRVARSILECSGNNAIIVDETANLQLALRSIVFGAIGTAGQRCTSTRRLFLQENIYSKFLTQLIAAYKRIKIGDPMDNNNHMGPLRDNKAVMDFNYAIEQVKNSGGTILFGGNTLQRKGFYVQPTLIEAQNHWPIVQQETFAPILYVIPYKNLVDAIAMQNDVEQGLSSALFTNDLRQAEQFLSAAGSDCGIANINIGTSGAEIGGAFGGEKATGGGREAGSDVWKSYMRRQTNTINWGSELPLAQGIKFDF